MFTTAGWRVWTRGARAQWTANSPSWPHNGVPGEIMSVRVTPTRGWQFLLAGSGPPSELRDCTLQDALAALPTDLREDAREAHKAAVAKALQEATKWTDRYMRLRAEAKL